MFNLNNLNKSLVQNWFSYPLARLTERGKGFEESYKSTILKSIILKTIRDIKVKEAPDESLVKKYINSAQFKY